MLKMFFMKYLPVAKSMNPKIKLALKFMFDISSVLILTMKSDKSFIKNLLHVRSKFISECEFQSRL